MKLVLQLQQSKVTHTVLLYIKYTKQTASYINKAPTKLQNQVLVSR